MYRQKPRESHLLELVVITSSFFDACGVLLSGGNEWRAHSGPMPQLRDPEP